MQKSILLFLCLLSLVGCVSQANFGDAITEGEPTPVATSVIPSRPIYEVQVGDVIDQRTYSGRISAVSSQQLVFPLAGRIEEILVPVGDDVTAGTVLAKLDTRELESQLLDAQEALAVAQALLDAATNQLDFLRQRANLEIELAQTYLDYANSAASTSPSPEASLLVRQREIELELAQLSLSQLEAGVDPALAFEVNRAQDTVNHLTELISQASLLAPMDGRFISFFFEVGDTVDAYETLGVVADLSQLEVTNVLDSAELSELTEGLAVILQRSNRPDTTFEGTIRQLPQPFGAANDGFLHVQFSNPATSSEFVLGERVSFVVTVAEVHDVLWLPAAAIREFTGRNFVVVLEDGLERRVDVSLGLQGNDRVEILAGLEANQRVIAP